MTYIKVFIIWYSFGVIFHILYTKQHYGKVLLSSIVQSMIWGFLGIFFPLAVLLTWIINEIDLFYIKNKNKKIF